MVVYLDILPLPLSSSSSSSSQLSLQLRLVIVIVKVIIVKNDVSYLDSRSRCILKPSGIIVNNVRYLVMLNYLAIYLGAITDINLQWMEQNKAICIKANYERAFLKRDIPYSPRPMMREECYTKHW